MTPELNKLIQQQINRENLPDSFIETITHYYQPLTEKIAHYQQKKNHPIVIGINGAQGSGKSTAAAFIETLLNHQHKLATAVISIDDIYLTKAERIQLANDIHPLLVTRGCPGTHDIELGINTINRLKTAKANDITAIPCFDKATDDRRDAGDWKTVTGSVDIVILEGWCVGATPQPADLLQQPVNDLERLEDTDGTWRGFVNASLGRDYQRLFQMLDYLIMLKVPSFSCVENFRQKQEDKLREKVARDNGDASGVMSPDEVRRFIMHYERLTDWMLSEMPRYADTVIEVSADHQIVNSLSKESLLK